MKTTKYLKYMVYPNEFKQTILNIINNAKRFYFKTKSKPKIEGLISINISAKERYLYRN